MVAGRMGVIQEEENMKVSRSVLIQFCLLLVLPLVAYAAQRRVIIDTDPGTDDAIALFMAMRSPDLKIEAITAVYGAGGPIEQTLANALRLVEIADRTDIPVAGGAAGPLMRTRRIRPAKGGVHGVNGLGGVVFPEPTTKPVVTSAPQLIREIIHKYPHEVSIVVLGPETNLALVLREEPGLASLIDEVVVMGGSLLRGNATPAAEANIYSDPEAARIVFHSGVKLTMVGLDPLLDGGLSKEDLQKLAASDKKVAQAAAKIAAGLWAGVRAGPPMWFTSPKFVDLPDPAAMAAFLDRSLFQWEQLYVDVETSGELTAGMTVPYRVAPMRRSPPLLGQPETSSLISDTFKPNCSAAVHVDGPRWVKMMMDLLTR